MASNAVKEGNRLLGKEGKLKCNADVVGTKFNAVTVGGNGNSVHEEAIRVVKPERGGNAESFDKGESNIGLSCGNELRVQEMGVEFSEKNVGVGSSSVCYSVEGMGVEFSEENVENVGAGWTAEEAVERGPVIGDVGSSGVSYRLIGEEGNVKVMVDVTLRKLGRSRKSVKRNVQYVNGQVFEEMVGYGVVAGYENVQVMERGGGSPRSSPTDNGIEVSGAVAPQKRGKRPRKVGANEIGVVDVEAEAQESSCFASDDCVYGGVNVEKLRERSRLAREGRTEGEAKVEGIESSQAKMERPMKGNATHCARYSFSFQDEKKDGFDFYDLVWCKLSCHMLNGFAYWWPGQIVDPSNASKMASDMQKDGHLLVAYFGNKKFGWCGESHVRHFQTYFQQLEKQRYMDSIQASVDAAAEEVSRRVELAMTCSCDSKAKTYTCMLNQRIKNSGMKKGKYCSAGNRAWIVDSFDPRKFIEYLYSLAVFPDEEACTLDLAILNAQINAIYCSKVRNREHPSLPEKRTHVTDNSGKKLSELMKNYHHKASNCNNCSRLVSSYSSRQNCKVADFTSIDSGKTKKQMIDSPDDTKANTQFNVGEILLRSDVETTKKCLVTKKYSKEDNDERHPEVISSGQSWRKCTVIKSEPYEAGMMSTGNVWDSYRSDIMVRNANGELISEGQRKRRKNNQEEVAVLASPSVKQEFEVERPPNNLQEVEECMPTEIIFTFGETYTLPSVANLVDIFGQYGPLRVAETEVLEDIKTARVVFKRRADAEVALSIAGKKGYFSQASVMLRNREPILTIPDCNIDVKKECFIF